MKLMDRLRCNKSHGIILGQPLSCIRWRCHQGAHQYALDEDHLDILISWIKKGLHA